MANRIATEQDRILYGQYITVGDLIIDTPTRPLEVNYYFMGSKDWKTLRENATIWIDGEKLGYVNLIRFRNSANEQTPWLIQNARMKNIPTTQVVCGGIVVFGLKNFELDGESEMFQGLLKWHPSRRFLSNHFGIRVINDNLKDGHGIESGVLNNGTITLKGFEMQHGFSGVRLSGNGYDVFVEKIEISNFYIHDTGHGEGFYLGATHTPPLAKLRNLRIKNGIIARTAAEAIQVQHLIGGSDISDIVIHRSATNWLCAFQPYQSGVIQWSIASGINKMSNIIVDGYSSGAFAPFGSDQNLIDISGSTSIVDNILFNDGSTGMYLHNSMKFGVNWIFKNLYYRQFHKLYFSDRTGEKYVPHIISSKNGTDNIRFESITHDGTKENVFQNTKGIEVGQIKIDTTLPAPSYMNSGFHEPNSRIAIWSQFMGGYFPSAIVKIDGVTTKVKVPTRWIVGDIAIDINTGYTFHKCIVDHITSTGTTVLSPIVSPNFMKLTWDENGVRNDQSTWDSTLKQSLFPPDDLRLKEDCFWRAKGFGVKDIVEQNRIIDHYIFDGEEYIVTVSKTYKRGV
jgi:hypothetical protein